MTKLILDKQAIGVDRPSTQNIMLLVIAALVPGTLAYAYFISPIIIINILIAVGCSLILEMLAVQLRGKNGLKAIQDGSIALAACLLALALPPSLPFWQLIVGSIIMVLLGKHVYGGIGHNPFNPAMVAYAALIISFPQSMTLWFAPGELHNIGLFNLMSAKFQFSSSITAAQTSWDGITQATPLEHVRSLRLQSLSAEKLEIVSRIVRSGWIWINLGFLVGGIYLLSKNIIQWHIPASVIGSFVILSLLFADNAIPTHYSVFSGALVLGAFFIATDPVTTASSHRGRVIFGIGVGSLAFVIREYGGYPEGVAFAVLIMNLCVPLIDHLELRAR